MSCETIPVTFKNKEGLKLFGILHKPTENIKDIGIIILSPGIKSRVAPHRLYLKMARHFADMGFYVLRFDFNGLGDSEGEIKETNVADFYGTVQVGKYVSDTVSAMDWMEKECKISHFILTGLCGGAITGLFAGAQDQRVKCLIGQSIPIILDSANITYDNFLTEGELKGKRDNYLQKLFDPKSSWRSWIRFVTFRSDYRLIFRSLLFPILRKGEKEQGEAASDTAEKKDNKNPYFPTAFKSIVSSGRKIYLLFAEADRLYWQFEENFRTPNKCYLDEHKNNISIHVIKNANHIFSYNEWQEELLEKYTLWLMDISGTGEMSSVPETV